MVLVGPSFADIAFRDETLWSFCLPGKWTWKNLVMFECSQKGEYVLLPHDFFYDILVLSCSELTVEITSLAERNKLPFICFISAYVRVAVGQFVLLR